MDKFFHNLKKNKAKGLENKISINLNYETKLIVHKLKLTYV